MASAMEDSTLNQGFFFAFCSMNELPWNGFTVHAHLDSRRVLSYHVFILHVVFALVRASSPSPSSSAVDEQNESSILRKDGSHRTTTDCREFSPFGGIVRGVAVGVVPGRRRVRTTVHRSIDPAC